jgi:hypothetical protein
MRALTPCKHAEIHAQERDGADALFGGSQGEGRIPPSRTLRSSVVLGSVGCPKHCGPAGRSSPPARKAARNSNVRTAQPPPPPSDPSGRSLTSSRARRPRGRRRRGPGGRRSPATPTRARARRRRRRRSRGGSARAARRRPSRRPC